MAPLLRDFVVEPAKGIHRSVRLVQQNLNLPQLLRSLLNVVVVLCSHPLLQPPNLPAIALSHNVVRSQS